MEPEGDELITCEPTETELTLYYLASVVDSLLEQLAWLKTIIDQEIGRILDEEKE